MENLEYKDTQDFAADVRLMFMNCYRYNSPDHVVVSMARKLQVSQLWLIKMTFLTSRSECSLVSNASSCKALLCVQLLLYNSGVVPSLHYCHGFKSRSTSSIFKDVFEMQFAKIPDEPSTYRSLLHPIVRKTASTSSDSSNESSEDTEEERARRLVELQNQVSGNIHVITI